MNALTERLDVVREQVTRVVREHARLRQELLAREHEAQEHQRMCAVLKERVGVLEKENEVLRNARPATTGQEASGTKERIDELVAEIDRCLELLHP